MNYLENSIFESELYFDAYSDKYKDENIKQEVGFIESFIKNKKVRILDLACGNGRHSIELAKRGYDVLGVDKSAFFLNIANTNSKEIDHIQFEQVALEDLDYSNEFNMAVSMFTSFGYNKDLKDDFNVLQRINKSLVDGGLFVLDLTNPYRFASRSNSNSQAEHISIDKQGNEIIIETKTQVDLLSQIAKIHRKIRKNDDVLLNTSQFRLYFPIQVTVLLEKLNFEDIKVFGDYDKSSFTMDSYRLIFVARKKEDCD